MINLHFNKLLCFDRVNEPVNVHVPFPLGTITNPNNVNVRDNTGSIVPTDVFPVSYWKDGSIKWANIYFLADLKANSACDYSIDILKNDTEYENIASKKDESIFVSTGKLNLQFSKKSDKIFELLSYNKRYLSTKDLQGPILIDSYGRNYSYTVEDVSIEQSGHVAATILVKGKHTFNDAPFFDFNMYFTVYKDKSLIDLQYCLKNTTDSDIQVQSLSFAFTPTYEPETSNNSIILTGTNGINLNSKNGDTLFWEITKEAANNACCCSVPEVYLATLTADYCDEIMGVTATMKNAVAKYPKSVSADATGVMLNIIQKTPVKVILKPSEEKTMDIQYDFHTFDNDLNLSKQNAISYEIGYVPVIEHEYMDRCGVTVLSSFNKDTQFLCYNAERELGINSFGNTFRLKDCMSMLNNYYITGDRAYYDTFIINAEDYADTVTTKKETDYYSCEVLLALYHFTNKKDVLKKAISLTNNLKTDRYNVGTALHTYMQLYNETYEENMLAAANKCVVAICNWYSEYNALLLPYEDISMIRIPAVIENILTGLCEYADATGDDEVIRLINAIRDDMNTHCACEYTGNITCDFPGIN